MESIIIIITSIVGACTTYALARYASWNKVLASALPSLCFYITVMILPAREIPSYVSILPAVFIGATFCGMTAPVVLDNFLTIAVSGLFFGMFFTVYPDFFKGYGGGLGTMACTAVIATVGMQRAWGLVVTGARKYHARDNRAT
jgi:hypothetical protein